MKVFIVRHGESETNRAELMTGWMDAALTEKGREDARLAAEHLTGIAFDRIYSSDLVRARCTAEIATARTPHELSPMLREIDVGTLAGKPLSVLDDAQRRSVAEDGYGIFGGETQEAFYQRVRDFMKMLEATEYQSVALFSHAGWLRAFLDIVVGVRLPRGAVCCRNCTVAVFEYGQSRWRLHSWINLY